MERLAASALAGPEALGAALDHLPAQYAAWIANQESHVANIESAHRQATARRLIAAADKARRRIADGIALLQRDAHARQALRAMNKAVARAARQRAAGPGSDPAAQAAPKWRPFQLAFILLNLRGLKEQAHPERELVDLLFFPTGGGKTEAYLGLAAWAIAHRRLTANGTLGAGVAVGMRYTLRLLTPGPDRRDAFFAVTRPALLLSSDPRRKSSVYPSKWKARSTGAPAPTISLRHPSFAQRSLQPLALRTERRIRVAA